MNRLARKWGTPLILLLLSGCSASLPRIDPAALPTLPAAFKESDGRWTAAPPAEAEPRGEWWKAFKDSVLDDLIERANGANDDIKVAAARLAQARAFLRGAKAERAPQANASATGARARGIVNGVPDVQRNLFSAGVDLSYEVDLFGRLRQVADAAALDARASEGLLRSTQLLVQSQVAQTYFALRALDAERELVRGTLRTYRETLALTERRWRAGDVAELDVARAAVEVAATESDALALERQRSALEHALAVLIGEVASAFALAPAEWTAALPVIPAGVPSTVLARRPDVSAAESELAAAQTRVGVAKAAWFPRLALTGSAGYASSDLGDLFAWSARSWGIGAIAATPIFDGGRRKAGIESAGAAFDAALARYREEILVAFKDVEDQLAALRLLAEQAEAQQRAVGSAAHATALSEARYRNGYVSQLELLDAQRSELRNRRLALQVRSARYQSTVALVRALGGGWN
jgi:multidrug efflux system outer membrane protein